jgi:hypothetical protein
MTFTFYRSLFTLHFAARRAPLAAALSALSLLVYWLGLLAPYNLFALRLKPLQDVAKLTRGQPLAQAGFVLTFAALSGLYYLLWRLCRAPASACADEHSLWFTVLGGLVVVNLALLWLYPIGAADVFDNILRGRIAAVYGGNPFYKIPSDYASDPFYHYSAWHYSPSAYGPLWELLAAGVSRLVGDNFLANLIGFKLLGLLFYAGCIALIAGVLQRHAPERALSGVVLFAWNPLVLYETAGNAHNDIVMAFFILLGMYFLSRDFRFVQRALARFPVSVGEFIPRALPCVSAALAFTAGALVKFISLLLIPLVLAVAWRAFSRRRPRLVAIVSASLAAAAFAALLYAPFWRGGDPLSLQRRETLFTASLPALIQAHLELPLGLMMSQRLVARITLLALGFAVLFQTLRVWREPDWLAPVRAAARLLLFYLLFTCLWFQSWYALWPLALAALLPEGALGRAIVLLSYSALWKTFVFDFFIFSGKKLPPRLLRETLLAPVTLGLTWLYAGYALLRSHICFSPRLAGDKSPEAKQGGEGRGVREGHRP